MKGYENDEEQQTYGTVQKRQYQIVYLAEQDEEKRPNRCAKYNLDSKGLQRPQNGRMDQL
jgi:formylmethanofuran dehydrogenase subunit B